MTVETNKIDITHDAELFRVLGHETRLRLLMLLAVGEHGVSEIDAMSGIGQPGLSQQLAILRKARLVVTRRAAKQVYYRVDAAVLARASAVLASLAQPGAPMVSAATDRGDGRQSRTGHSSAHFARMLP